MATFKSFVLIILYENRLQYWIFCVVSEGNSAYFKAQRSLVFSWRLPTELAFLGQAKYPFLGSAKSKQAFFLNLTYNFFTLSFFLSLSSFSKPFYSKKVNVQTYQLGTIFIPMSFGSWCHGAFSHSCSYGWSWQKPDKGYCKRHQEKQWRSLSVGIGGEL